MKHFTTLAGLSCLSLALSGCATVNFAPPRLEKAVTQAEIDACPAANMDIPAFLDCTKLLHRRYNEAAAQLANGQQAFDLPMFGLASSALSAAAFNKKPDLVKRSAVAIVTLTGLRTYYQAEPRRLVILQAGKAIRCVYQTSNSLRILDSAKITEWKKAYDNSKDFSPKTSADIQKYGRLVLSTQGRIESAVYDIEDQLQRKLTSPSQPVFAGFGTDYDALLQKLKASESSAGDAAGAAQTRKTMLEPKVLVAKTATAAEISENAAANLLLDKALLEDLDSLDTKLKGCTDLMAS